MPHSKPPLFSHMLVGGKIRRSSAFLVLLALMSATSIRAEWSTVQTNGLTSEARRHVESAFSDAWLKRGEFLFSKQSDGERVFEISDFSIKVEEGKKPLTRADQLNGVEWKGQVRVHWSAERTWYKGFGWTEWTEGETVEIDLVRKKGVWKTNSGNRLADSIRPEVAEHLPLVKPTPAEIIEIEDDPTMSEETLLKIQGESGTPATPRPAILSQMTVTIQPVGKNETGK